MGEGAVEVLVRKSRHAVVDCQEVHTAVGGAGVQGIAFFLESIPRTRRHIQEQVRRRLAQVALGVAPGDQADFAHLPGPDPGVVGVCLKHGDRAAPFLLAAHIVEGTAADRCPGKFRIVGLAERLASVFLRQDIKAQRGERSRSPCCSVKVSAKGFLSRRGTSIRSRRSEVAPNSGVVVRTSTAVRRSPSDQ